MENAHDRGAECFFHRRHRRLEQPIGQKAHAFNFRHRHRVAKCPHRAVVAVVAADVFQPLAVVAHEVAELAQPVVERVRQEREVALGQSLGANVAHLLVEREGGDERTGVVVGAVAVPAIGHREQCVLQHASVVGQPLEVIEVRLVFDVRHNRRKDRPGHLYATKPPLGHHLRAQVCVGLADFRPDHRSAVLVRLFAHRVAGFVVGEQLAHAIGQCVAVVERE